MNQFKNFLTSLRLSRLILVFITGLSLLVSTACAANPPAPIVSGESSKFEQRGQQTELYAPTAKREGGMNNYSDVDPRRDTTGAELKAKALIDDARDKRIANPKEAVDNLKDSLKAKPAGERARELSKDVKESTSNSAEDFAEGTKRGVRNLKASTERAKQGVERTADDASNYVQDKADDTARATRRTLDRVDDNIDKST
jgi:hypothetical protein